MRSTALTDDLPSATGDDQVHPALRVLAPLVGTWRISGPGHSGHVTDAWMAGGRFLVQHVDLLQDGQRTTGVEYIGPDQASRTLRSHYFGTSGDLLEYVYELSGDELTIWFGDVGSPAKFTGTFTDDGQVNTGQWSWPGGGYTSTMARQPEP